MTKFSTFKKSKYHNLLLVLFCWGTLVTRRHLPGSYFLNQVLIWSQVTDSLKERKEKKKKGNYPFFTAMNSPEAGKAAKVCYAWGFQQLFSLFCIFKWEKLYLDSILFILLSFMVMPFFFSLHILNKNCKYLRCPTRWVGGSDGKESACNAEDRGLISGLGRSLEKGMATHSSILA